MPSIALLTGLALMGCPQQDRVANPSGTCTAMGDGSRAGYHSAQDTTWLPDCSNPLLREYWRVFQQKDGSAYTIPRLDGHRWLQPPCGDSAHELSPLVQNYLLCQSAMSTQAVDRVNDMAPADALRLTRFLHEQLRSIGFVVADGGVGIDPYPIPVDVVDACDLEPNENSAAFDTLCRRERERLASGQDIGFSYTGPGADELAQRLNELYGTLARP